MNNELNTAENNDQRVVFHVRKSITNNGFEGRVTHNGYHRAGYLGNNPDEIEKNIKRWCKELGIDKFEIDTDGENLTGEAALDNSAKTKIQKIFNSNVAA